MAIDPQVAPLLELAANGPRLEESTPTDARAHMRELAAGLPPGPELARVEDRSIPGPGGEIPVRIYGASAAPMQPVLAYFHGGGWVIGDLETHDALCRSIAAESRALVVSVHYRLAPEHRFPAALDDCFAVTDWLSRSGREIGADPSRVGVAGDSAGGHLAATVALRARDTDGPRLRFQGLIYPVTDCAFDTTSYRDNAEGYILTRDAMVWFWKHFLGADLTRAAETYASPLREPDLGRLPPAYVATAEYDPLLDEGDRYAERLASAGVEVEHVRYGGMVHGFFRQLDLVDRASDGLRDFCDAVGRWLIG